MQSNEALDFLNVMQEVQTFDAGFIGSPYTWCNNQHGAARVWKRLDWVLLNNQVPLLNVQLVVRYPLAYETSTKHAKLNNPWIHVTMHKT